MQSDKFSILCVESYADTLELLTVIFEEKGYDVTACGSMNDCLPLVYKSNFDAIVLDNLIGGIKSLDVSRKIREYDKKIPIVFFSAEVRKKEIEKAMETGANAYLIKPADFDDLINTVTKLIQDNQ